MSGGLRISRCLPLRLYIAGSSLERDLVAHWMGKARELGCEITYDWVQAVRDVGEANPPDEDTRYRYAWLDYEGVEGCNKFWLLMPRRDGGRGAFVELGLAVGMRNCETIVSGVNYDSTIMTALAARCFRFHDEALEYLGTEMARFRELDAMAERLEAKANVGQGNQ